MYPVRLGYETAVKRINKLNENGHHAEALVTSVFTVEKTLRRTLREIVVSAGFASKFADKIIGKLRGFDAIKSAWEMYEPNNEKLTNIIAAVDWKLFVDAASMRNEMVHGVRVYDLSVCEDKSSEVLDALDRLKTLLDKRYGFSGWETCSKRIKHRLHLDPKVRISE